MDGVKLATSALFSPAVPGDARWKVAGTADLNKDGRPDLVFQHDDGTLVAWLLNGLSMTQTSLLTPANPGLGWRVAGVADRNQDGKPDFLFQHTNRDLAVWHMDGLKLVTAQYLNPRNPGGTWKPVAPR
jgi:hypothetical protein